MILLRFFKKLIYSFLTKRLSLEEFFLNLKLFEVKKKDHPLIL